MNSVVYILTIFGVVISSTKCAIHPYYFGLQMGIGADSTINQYYATALANITTKVETYASGQSTDWSLTQITSSQELNEALDISSSASFKGYGASFSASYSFSKKTSLNKYSTHLLVQVWVKNAAENIPRPELSQEAKDYLTQFDLERFEEAYGSEYLGGVISGGMYLGMITINTQSESEKQKTATGVRFSGYGAGFKLDISKEVEEIFKKRRVDVYGVQVGGQPQSLATTIEDMVEQLKNFPSQVLQYPVPILGIFNDYQRTIAYDWQGQSIDFQIRNQILQSLSIRAANLKDRRSDLEYVQQNYDQFEEFKPKSKDEKIQDLNQILNEIKSIIDETNTINKAASECAKDYTKCSEPKPNYTEIFKLPSQNNNEIFSESVGMSMMYFGDLNKLPYGWQICDGTSGTPDLRGRFALGNMQFESGTDRVQSSKFQSVGQNGGKSSIHLTNHELPFHTHSIGSAGNHHHRFRDYWFSEIGCSHIQINAFGTGSKTDYDNHQCYYDHNTEDAGEHTHHIGPTGAQLPFEIVPPYTVVYYICKVK